MTENPTPNSGPERIARDAIPAGVTEAAVAKLLPGGAVHPAREGGTYKGKVLYADGEFVVQAVGNAGKSAVVHQRSDLELVDQNVQWRAANNRLGSTPIQVHYKGDNPQAGKVYRWNQEREQADRAMVKAQTFAKDIADPKERDAFLKHTGAMLRRAAGGLEMPAAEKAAKRPTTVEKSAPGKVTAVDAPKDAGNKATKGRAALDSLGKSPQRVVTGPER